MGIKQVLDHSRVEETKLRVRWDDTLVELDFEAKLKELTDKYGVDQGDTFILYRNSY